ncbi:MAG: cysteine desulfurase [Roseburia sp.]|nr:cysteine desulfurase [Roseburia sp.]
MNEMIYLDHAATTPMLPEVLEAMMPYQKEYYGNPSTIYEFGEKSREAIERARAVIAATIHAREEEIFFTSGGTESDNWALKEAANLYSRTNPGKYGHILTSPIEHHAIINTCEELKIMGCSVTFLPVDETGLVVLGKVEENIAENTCLLSVMYANNEIGTIQPVEELARMAKKNQLIFHTDAVQAYGHVPIDVRKSGIDMLSVSAHKFGGPKGVGFLYIRKEINLPSFIQGGAQESNRRAGTENVPGIVGMGKAAELAHRRMWEENRRVKRMRDRLVYRVLREIPEVKFMGNVKKRLSNNANFCFNGIVGESAAVLLDTQGICVSSGSACSTGQTEVSHVMKAIGVSEEWAQGALRFTLGAENTMEEIDYTVEKLKYIVKDMREKGIS